jgi:hypothetical protein
METIENFCDLGVDVQHTVAVKGTDFLSPQNADFASVFRGRETFTYEGTTVTLRFAGRFVDRIVEGVEEGPHVHEFTTVGLPELFKVQGGGVLTRDAGRITFRVAFDENDEVLSEEIVFIAGPHPNAESGFELFCEVIPEALGIES